MKKVNLVLSKTFIVIMALITLFPFVYMILSSLMTYQEATSIPPTLFPEKFQWGNFALAMEQAPFVRYFFNTILVAGVSTIGTIITSILAGFALVKLEFKYKNALVLGMAALLMVPYEVTVYKLSNNCSAWIIRYIYSINSSIISKRVLHILFERVLNKYSYFVL